MGTNLFIILKGYKKRVQPLLEKIAVGTKKRVQRIFCGEKGTNTGYKENGGNPVGTTKKMPVQVGEEQ